MDKVMAVLHWLLDRAETVWSAVILQAGLLGRSNERAKHHGPVA
jgi:hypothetical protein